MAATAVYIRLAPIPLASTALVDVPPAFANISATTAAFTLTIGGMFMATCIGSTFGTVKLQMLGPDDSTWLDVYMQIGTATVTTGTIQGTADGFAANGNATVYLSPGRYMWVLA